MLEPEKSTALELKTVVPAALVASAEPVVPAALVASAELVVPVECSPVEMPPALTALKQPEPRKQ